MTEQLPNYVWFGVTAGNTLLHVNAIDEEDAALATKEHLAGERNLGYGIVDPGVDKEINRLPNERNQLYHKIYPSAGSMVVFQGVIMDQRLEGKIYAAQALDRLAS